MINRIDIFAMGKKAGVTHLTNRDQSRTRWYDPRLSDSIINSDGFYQTDEFVTGWKERNKSHRTRKHDARAHQ